MKMFLAVSKIKKHPLLFFLLFLALLVFVLFILQFALQKKQSPSVLTSPTGTTTRFQSVEFSGSLPSFPQVLPLYSSTPLTSDLREFSTKLAQKLQLKESGVEGYWVRENKTSFLLIDEVSQAVTYTVQASPEVETPLSYETALVPAQDFLDSLGFSSLSPQKDQVLYFNDLHGAPLQNVSASAIIIIPFTLTVDGFPLYAENSSLPVALITLSSRGIEAARFLPYQYTQAQVEKTYSTRPVENALQEIKSGGGTFLTIGVNNRAQTPIDVSVQDFSSIIFTQVSLEYRSVDQTYFPYFRFVGTATTPQNYTSIMEVIVPAVQP